MRYAREALRVALSGAGFLFAPLLIVTVAWFLYALSVALVAGLTDTSAMLWKEALGLKVVWVIVAVRGHHRLRAGCQE